MKTIKFKAWDPILKCWICEDDMPILGDGTSMVLEFGKTWVTFCQWTGLKDKNGKEIWEGDIVKMKAIVAAQEGNSLYDGTPDMDIDYTGEVVIIASKGACLKNPHYVDIENDETGDLNYYKPIAAYRSEVIGNIYENPEMVKP
jgi:uncharacterized phage protein (TIGR01671 family)